VVSSAPFITGILYLGSATLARGQAPPAGTQALPEDRPKAA